jgi:hypothetical protein
MLDKSEVDTGSHDYHKTKPFGDTPALRSFYMLIQHKKDKRKILTNYQKALNIHKKFRKESNNGFEYLSGYTEQE